MITAHPSTPVGSVLRLQSFAPCDFPSDAAILCRNTAPLIAFAFDLLRRGIACHVVGKDIQVGLEKLLDKVNRHNKNETQIALREHCMSEMQRLTRKGKKAQAANYEDKCTALAMLIDRHSNEDTNANGIDGVKEAIKKIFASGDGITLSTGHRSKGLEWDTVFILDWNLCPSPFAETEDALTQEKNLQYVMVTRAKTHLRFIESGNWKELEKR
jgi:DNA helicase-2/ATP-dependent DNA helicase PcrA